MPFDPPFNAVGVGVSLVLLVDAKRPWERVLDAEVEFKFGKVVMTD